MGTAQCDRSPKALGQEASKWLLTLAYKTAVYMPPGWHWGTVCLFLADEAKQPSLVRLPSSGCTAGALRFIGLINGSSVANACHLHSGKRLFSHFLFYSCLLLLGELILPLDKTSEGGSNHNSASSWILKQGAVFFFLLGVCNKTTKVHASS